MAFHENLVKEMRRILARGGAKQVSEQEAREALRNLSGFFRVLLEWGDRDSPKGELDNHAEEKGRRNR